MKQTRTRDDINALAQYLSDAYDSVPPNQWLSALTALDRQNASHPAQKTEGLERILSIARDVDGSALPCLAQLVVAKGSPPKIDEIRANALRPVGLPDMIYDVQPDMLLAPDRYLTRSLDITLDDRQLEIAFPPMHPGPEQGSVLLWTGQGAGQPRVLRHWREQRDRLAAAQWTFNSGETVRPLDHAFNSLTARSLPEARFLRHVITLPVAVLQRAAACGSPMHARVDWTFDDSPELPELLANVALVGVSGVRQHSILRSVVVNQAGHAEVPLSEGTLQFWPRAVQYVNPNAENAIIPRRDKAQAVQPIGTAWDFDVVERTLVVSGLTPGETVDLVIDLRLQRIKQLPTNTPAEWSGPAAMRWCTKASLMDGGVPLHLGPDQIVTPADICTALRALDPFPETLRLAKSDINIAPCLFMTESGLRLGYRVRIGLVQGGALNVAPNVHAAVQEMLQQILQQDMPLRVDLHDDC